MFPVMINLRWFVLVYSFLLRLSIGNFGEALSLRSPSISHELPKPTLAQQRYGGTISALVVFNMQTYGNCNADSWNNETLGKTSDPRSFHPAKLNVSNWIESFQAMGVKLAVLTAKHDCGFLLWESNTRKPDGHKWTYQVDAKYPVVEEFVKHCKHHDIDYGFYYNLENNFYLNVAGFEVQSEDDLIPNQLNVSQEYFEDLTVAQMKELWSTFTNISEIWLDGGVSGSLQKRVRDLVYETGVEKAIAFNGYGISPNPVRWCGTESGHPLTGAGGEVWSTSCCEPAWCPSGAGSGCSPDSDGAVFQPSGIDVTLQQEDVWFYRTGLKLHNLTELIEFYHNSVGANGHLELDWAIDQDGLVHPDHMNRYKQFGFWIQSCYGNPLNTSLLSFGMESAMFTFATPTMMDRVSLEENLSRGQLTVRYSVQVMLAGSMSWVVFSEGVTIGTKRIDIPGEIFWVLAVQLTIEEAYDYPEVTLKAFSPQHCRV